MENIKAKMLEAIQGKKFKLTGQLPTHGHAAEACTAICESEMIKFAEWIPHNAYIENDEYYFVSYLTDTKVSFEELLNLYKSHNNGK